jgi:cation transport ATPase
VRAAEDAGIEVSGVRATTGAGVEGVVAGEIWRLGRPEFVGVLHGGAVPADVEVIVGAGDTVIALGNAAGWVAFFRLSDGLRPEASAMVAPDSLQPGPGYRYSVATPRPLLRESARCSV